MTHSRGGFKERQRARNKKRGESAGERRRRQDRRRDRSREARGRARESRNRATSKEFQRRTTAEGTRQREFEARRAAEAQQTAAASGKVSAAEAGITEQATQPAEKSLFQKGLDIAGSPNLTQSLLGANLAIIPAGRFIGLGGFRVLKSGRISFSQGKFFGGGKGAKTFANTKIGQTHDANGKILRGATNSKTRKLVIATLALFGLSSTAINLLRIPFESKNFARFIGMEEIHQQLGFAHKRALSAGRLDIAEALEGEIDNILSEAAQAEINEALPYEDQKIAYESYARGARLVNAVNKALTQDQRNKIQNNMTDNEIWDRRQEENREANKQADIERIGRLEIYNKNKRKAEIEGRNEDAAFWAAQDAEERRLNAIEREEQAVFWLEYQKQKAKLREESQPSKLGFGLL
jgi:hypothetical protein